MNHPNDPDHHGRDTQQTRRWAKRLAVTVTAAAAGLILTAGACEQRGTTDAPIDTRLQDNQSPYIVNEPNRYMNLALKCAGADLLVAHTRAAPPVVAVDASLCEPGVAEQLGIPRVGGYTPEADR